VLWHAANAQHRLQNYLPAEMEGIDLQVQGVVTSLPEVREINQQFIFYIDAGPNGFEHRKILLNYYGPETISASQDWQFQVRLKRPHGFVNPGTFDYEAWLFQQGISAKGYVRDSIANQLMGQSKQSILAIRDRLRQKIVSHTEGFKQQAIILALAMSDRSLISNQQWQVFSRTGTNHLVVVSGLHIGFIAGLCFLFGSFLWRLSSGLMLWVPAQKVGAVTALVGACFYSVLAGFSLPTQRALVMVAVFMLARIFAVRQGSLFSLLLSLVIVLLLDPFAAITAGFWLSFTAVAGLLLVFAGAPADSNKLVIRLLWDRWFKAQFVVFLPLTLWVGEVSMVSPIANTFAIPLVSWLVLPLCLLAVALLSFLPEIASVCFQWADQLLQTMSLALEWIAQTDLLMGAWQLTLESKLIVLFCATGFGLLILPLFAGARLLGVMLLLPVLFPRQVARSSDTLELHVLDVGQGLASVLLTRNHVLVYDTGAGYTDGFDSGTQILLPVLARLGIRKVDVLIISHGDNDHSGGAAGLIEGIEVDRVLSSEDQLKIAMNSEACIAGQQWVWDSVKFTILHPEDRANLNKNNGSCVLRVQLGEHSILLPGDIESRIELQLLQRSKGDLSADILVAAHHGSKTSSSRRFISALDPEYVLFSAGYLNQFRHPSEEVQQRFQEAGVKLLNTAESGMISFYLEKGETQFQLRQHRFPRQRYWN